MIDEHVWHINGESSASTTTVDGGDSTTMPAVMPLPIGTSAPSSGDCSIVVAVAAAVVAGGGGGGGGGVSGGADGGFDNGAANVLPVVT